MKTSNKIIILLVSITLGLATLMVAGQFFLSAISNANVNVTPSTPTPPTPPVPQSGGGGAGLLITPTQTPTTTDAINQIANQIAIITQQISDLFKGQKSQIAESVPKETPLALQGLKIIIVDPISGLVLSPVRTDIGFLANKLPQLKKTLDGLSVDVNNLNDIKKLSQTKLYLPGLTQTVSPESSKVNWLAQIQGIPLLKLSEQAIAKIPTNIVFASTAGGLIDFIPALTVDNKGNTEQKITTISGKPMELVIKPESPASSIIGLIIFKDSGVPSGSSKQNSQAQNPIGRLFSAALSVANPKPAPQSSELSGLIVQKFAYTEVKPGLFTAEINAPTPEGEYEINTIVAYKDQSVIPTETRLTALVDPEGYVYQKISGLQARIANTTVSLYWLNPNTNKYEIWQAGKFMQKNPVITDTTGNYSFLVPSGTYYLTAKAPNYYDYKSESFVIKENNSVAMDIELKAKKVGWFNWVEVIAISLLVIIVLFCILIMVHIKGRNNSF